MAARLDLPARAARTATTAAPLPEHLATRAAELGIDALYTHQAAAVDALRAGRHCVLATGTASGKSLGFQLPIAEAMLGAEPATALLVYPTKALAQDQLRALRRWLVPNLVADTYDGDRDPDDRARIRREANVVLTNPDMLHQGILPFHARWATFLMRLRYVVVDELHTLRGIFGTHVTYVLRRLLRLARHYGAEPTVCFASATIGNPGELATALLGEPVIAITDDGSPAADRELVVWRRPFVDAEQGIRPSANRATARLLARFVHDGVPTIAFTRSRRGTEAVALAARSDLKKSDEPELETAVAAYRSGYRPEERRALEDALHRGHLLGVAATSALELGIDIGGLDAVVLNGFPGTLASFWQQVGRAGRAGRPAVAVLVAGDDQLDEWYATHPEDLLARTPEAAVVNPDNPHVLLPHVACAAHELPLAPTDDRYFGPGLDDAVLDLVRRDLLKPRDGLLYWAGRHAPAPRVGLRNGGGAEFELVLEGTDQLIGTVDAGRVWDAAHEGAIYLHQGRRYRVVELDLDARAARLEPADTDDEYTTTRRTTDLTIDRADDPQPQGHGAAALADVTVIEQITAYQRRRVSTRALIETVPLDAPPSELRTRACVYTVALADLVAAGMEPGRVLGAVHAAEHALIGMLPRFAICDRWDVGGVSMALHPQTGHPTIVVYDGSPGGTGIAELAFATRQRHVAAAADLVAHCPCTGGCPSCVQSPKCGNGNVYLDKDGALTLLKLLGSPSDG